MDLQKQPVLATKEQLRLAELTQTGNDVAVGHDDIALQKRVKKVIELTRCTQSQAEVALIDSEDNVEDAVARLLDNPEKLVLWSQQVKNKKVKAATPSVANESKIGHGRRTDSRRGRQRHGFSTVERSYGDTRGLEKDDEWKNGPRVFMPSSVSAVATETSTNSGAKSASNWPALDIFSPSETTEPAAVQQPKTFAAVAAAKKAPPPRVQQPAMAQQPTLPLLVEPSSTTTSATQNEPIIPRANLETKMSDGPVVEWSNSIDWGTVEMDHSQEKVEFVTGDALPPPTVDHSQEKVEFVTGDALPPPTSTSYQFGFHFSSAKDNESAWGHQQHIPSVENSAGPVAIPEVIARLLDNSGKDSSDHRQHIPSADESTTGDMLNTMSNIPTTSSSVSAHFNAISQQEQAIEAHQRINNGATRPTNALSFSDTASVNFPPSGGPSGGGSVVGHAIPTNFAAQQSDPSHAAHPQHQMPPQNKMFAPAASPSMVSAPPAMQQHLQHHQQQAQTIFHQTSAAAVPQFPNYNMPYMYSPVAAAQTLPAPNAELDRFLIQQYGAAPYSQLDLQMGAMSIGPPTTLAPNHHRATLDSYMENKFGQQQQNVNQAGNNGHYQQSQQTQQQRGLAQSEPAALLGGPPSHVGPPPGFGMPTAPTQPSYVQPANIHSLFQMPTYPHPYQHPQYLMSNANRLQTAQRPAQTSPPENNVQSQRRAGNDAQGYAGGAVQETGDQHSAGVSQQYGNNFNHKYRSYM